MRILFVELKTLKCDSRPGYGLASTRDLSHVVGVVIWSPVNLGTEAGIYVLSADKRTGQSRFTMTFAGYGSERVLSPRPSKAMRKALIEVALAESQGKVAGPHGAAVKLWNSTVDA